GRIKANGDMRKAYSTPVFFKKNGHTVMIATGAKASYAYNPENGKELWQVRFKGFSAASRPAVSKTVAVINSGYPRPEVLAVSLDAEGLIADDAVKWRRSASCPKRCSPLLIDGRLYLLDDKGIIACLDAETGAQIWRDRVRGQFSASPLYAHGRIYCFDERGTTTVLEPGEVYKVLATNKLDDGFMASPAVAGNDFILRTKGALYRISK
ncbi:MAG: PQQ-binding-like beta-propeller repeat protein, partial [Verrucomicrobiota bacterium]